MSNEPLETKTANSLAAGNPGTISLGGEVYLISQPTKADFLTLKKELTRQWKALKKGTADSFLKQIKADVAELPPDLQRMAMESACKVNATPREPAPHELEELLLEKNGIAFWAWLLARKIQPNVTLADFKAHITDENVNEIIGQILDANGLKEADPNGNGGEWFHFVVDDDTDIAAWYRRMGSDLQFPPWMIASTLPIPQMYGLWHGEQTEGLTREKAVEVANRIRKRKGLEPLKSGLPSCCKAPSPDWEEKRKLQRQQKKALRQSARNRSNRN